MFTVSKRTSELHKDGISKLQQYCIRQIQPACQNCLLSTIDFKKRNIVRLP